ncbi:MAG: iron ABC transporter permease [Bacteroidales bacterium]|jgi:iron complex transport system permease protein|nr:iron ABC transporter permease [Bacteroidales bacterium]MDD2205162.1 iron ABC transporter permease [Bacteroidales bacterium]MDD3914712.1 iron ABC transporter permease [Bacteroidales bacterium]MDD4634572.1 iron ABC transporter permease [Bacteroidales bacterium]
MKNSLKLIIAVALIAGLVFLNLCVGSANINFEEFWNYFIGKSCDSTNSFIIGYRINSSLTAVFAGAGLAVAGLLLQTLFNNPLADPSVLGISSGASVGVACCLLIFGSSQLSVLHFTPISRQMVVSAASFIGTIPVLLLLLLLSKRTNNKLVILITGLMFSFINSSIVTIVEFFSMKESLYSYVMWGMGSFSNVPSEMMTVFIVSIAVVLTMSFFLIKPLNAVLLGDNYAANLGVNVKRLRFFCILFSGVIIALITAYCGPIGFIGLAVPHIVRMLLKTSDHAMLLVACIIFGAALSLLCLLITRLPGFDGALPVNVVTAIIGAPILIKILFTPSIKNAK